MSIRGGDSPVPKIHSVSVRALAEFAFERGDLIPAARAAARMRDGTRGHQALQALLPVSWRAEVPVSRDIAVDCGCTAGPTRCLPTGRP